MIATTDVPHVRPYYSYQLPLRSNWLLGGWVLTGTKQYFTGVPIVLS
ncbi:MAG: hypothetical protein WKF37_17090 [Bryobacteraceae bacterium]